MVSDLHRIKITSPDGRGVLTTVELDGEPLKGVSFVNLTVDVHHDVIVTLGLYADLVIEGEARIVRQWRQGLPWWRRLPYWLHRGRAA